MATFTEQQKKEMRVKIAQDVIFSLKIKRYVPTKGNYFCVPRSLPVSDDITLTSLIKTKKCQVCALGSMFTEMVKDSSEKLEDKWWDVHEGLDRGDMTEDLETFFTEKQLDMIEEAFECWCGDGINFHNLLCLDSSKRLRLIMENVVANDGTFVPTEDWVAKCCEEAN